MGSHEPIAIVGMGCRFPGASSPDELWRLLLDGRDAVTATAPAGRPDGTAPDPRPGRLVSLAGSDRSLTAREAAVDPQHRVLLATAADALADAGLAGADVEGRELGVFMGRSADAHQAPPRVAEPQADDGPGTASGRISHALDLRGPCATVDAACSSGTLAVHLACQSLRTGECDTALAGGVGPVPGADPTAEYPTAGMPSPAGRSALGSDATDGFVLADGAAVFVLKRLGRALIDGDRVHAVVLGSAQASKGRTAKAVIAPSVEGYLQVIGRAAANAGVNPGRIGYVEAHGNAAPAGDTVELQAIGAAIGAHRPAGQPCLVGSVKTNLGHAEAAGGLAGLLKAALAVRHRILPASLHATPPTSAVDWAGLRLAPVPERRGWPDAGPAVAGVNTYGLSGTFVHLLVGEPPAGTSPADGQGSRTPPAGTSPADRPGG
ncbi:polyketide synthase [Longispora sp. K20-0274]|uniref:beta-ketoacyl [acyl carrier protein] synthase domain-containing protein n=1 Tax=Longispora sp. K20-0274 TaxID=3088255 RepID=UPI00399A757C